MSIEQSTQPSATPVSAQESTQEVLKCDICGKMGYYPNEYDCKYSIGVEKCRVLQQRWDARRIRINQERAVGVKLPRDATHKVCIRTGGGGFFGGSLVVNTCEPCSHDAECSQPETQNCPALVYPNEVYTLIDWNKK